MDPLTMMALAQVAVSGSSLIYNHFAGEKNRKDQKGQLKDAYGLQQDQLALQSQQIIQGEAQGRTQIAQGAGNTAAGLASRGIAGPMATMAVDGQVADQTKQLNQGVANQRQALANQRVSLRMNYQSGLDTLKAQGDQANMDSLFGALGVGLSAAGAMVDGGAFGSAAQESFSIGNNVTGPEAMRLNYLYGSKPKPISGGPESLRLDYLYGTKR